MKVLIVGSGGREHALAWKCAQSPRVSEVLVAPGNGGTATEPRVRNVDVAAEDVAGLVALAKAEKVGLTIIGERFKGSELVSANAAYVILYSLGLLLGPSVQGVALDVWNPHGLLVALGGICAAYVLFLLRPRAAPL